MTRLQVTVLLLWMLIATVGAIFNWRLVLFVILGGAGMACFAALIVATFVALSQTQTERIDDEE